MFQLLYFSYYFFLSITVTLLSIIKYIVLFLRRHAWRFPLREQELSTLLEYHISPISFSGFLVPHFCVVFCGSLLVVLFFSSVIFLNSYKYQEIAHIYLQNNLFGVVDIAFTSNECYYRFNHCRIKSLTRGLVFPAIYPSNDVHAHRCERWYFSAMKKDFSYSYVILLLQSQLRSEK